MWHWLLAALLLFTSPVWAEDAEPIELRVASYLPPMSVAVSKVMEPWLTQVESATGAQVSFRRYWGGSLGRGPFRQYLLVENGVADIAYLFLSMHAGRFPDVDVLEMPALFSSSEEASTTGWALFEEGMMRGFDDVKVLGIFTTAPGRLFTKNTLSSLNGYAGLKLRAAGQVQGAYVTALGATPEIIDAATATDALRRGTIDGLIQGWTGMAIFRQVDVTEHYFDIPVGVLPFAVVMSQDAWDRLPQKVQIQIMSVSGKALSQAGGQAYDKAATGFQKNFLESGALRSSKVNEQESNRLNTIIQTIRSNWSATDPHRASVLERAQELKADFNGN